VLASAQITPTHSDAPCYYIALNCPLDHCASPRWLVPALRRVIEARITVRRDRTAVQGVLCGWRALCAELRHGRCHAEALHAKRADAEMVSDRAADPH